MVKSHINITIERELLKDLDNYLKKRKAKMSRSFFIELAVDHFLRELKASGEKSDLAIVKP